MEKRIPRLPTEQELREIATIERSDREPDISEAMSFLQNACVAVFDSYTPDTPGYAGKIAIVVWPAGAEMITVYGWKNNEPYWIA